MTRVADRPLFGAWTWGGGWLGQRGNSLGHLVVDLEHRGHGHRGTARHGAVTPRR